jgi:hypothetical protein
MLLQGWSYLDIGGPFKLITTIGDEFIDGKSIDDNKMKYVLGSKKPKKLK